MEQKMYFGAGKTSAVMLLALIFLNILAVKAQPTTVDTFLRREMKERRIPGLQVAVVQHGKMVLLQSYGIANLQDSVPVTNTSIFAINSCTKAFTGVAIMQLVEAGKVDLAAPVSRYLEGLPPAWQPVTVRQLLTHVSGLPDILRVFNPATNGLGGVGTEEAAWAKVKALPMNFATGTEFSYNQTNYALLGKIIEKFSGKLFTQVFHDQQFTVAGMPRTLFGDSRDVIFGMAPTYRYVTNLEGQEFSEGKLTANYSEFPFFSRTSSGLNSTAEDIAHWLMALQQGKILKNKASLQTLWTAGTYNNGTPTQWAMGWVTKPRPKHRAVIATGGGRSAFFVYPDDDLAIVVLTNLAGASQEDFIDELAGYYQPGIPAADPVTTLRIQLRQRGFEKAIPVMLELQKKDPQFKPLEVDLNDWGYRMLSKKQLKEALAILKLNVWLYPQSWNVYDSYGEALLNNGQKEEAAQMYQKSIRLNPNNQHGKQVLAQILKNSK